MYTISTDLTNALDKSFRDKSHVRITYGLVDPDAPSLSTLADNGHLDYSILNDAETPKFEVTTTYGTLELNRFALDGLGLLKSDSDTYKQGYIGSAVSGADGTFTVNPTITINFSDFLSLSGLTFNFDTIMDEYPSLFNVTAYNNTTVVHTADYVPTRSGMYAITDQMETINKLVFEFKKTVLPYRRIRIFNLFYGLVIQLNTENINTCTLSQTVEFGCFSLPKNNFTFEILDLERSYDPENPDNLLKFLEAWQEVDFEIGHKLDTGAIEYVPMAHTYSDGTSSVTDGGVCKIVTFNSNSLLDMLNKVYDEWVYSAGGYTLYQLATNILTFAGFTGKFTLDTSLKSVTTKMILSGKTVRELLQLIANAGNCNLLVQRDGTVKIAPNPNVASAFDFTLMKVTSDPTLSRIPAIRQFTSKYKAVSLEANSEIGKVDITGASSTQYVIEYEPSTGITYTNSGLTVVGTPQIFSTKMVITVTGSGTIVVSGTKLKYTDVVYSTTVNPIGSDLEVSNELISDKTSCIAFVNYQIGLFAKQDSYSFDHRGFPQTDLLDNVTMQNIHEDIIPAKVIENSITFNGIISGKTKVVTN
jgi:hypothetical protein